MILSFTLPRACVLDAAVLDVLQQVYHSRLMQNLFRRNCLRGRGLRLCWQAGGSSEGRMDVIVNLLALFVRRSKPLGTVFASQPSQLAFRKLPRTDDGTFSHLRV